MTILFSCLLAFLKSRTLLSDRQRRHENTNTAARPSVRDQNHSNCGFSQLSSKICWTWIIPHFYPLLFKQEVVYVDKLLQRKVKLDEKRRGNMINVRSDRVWDPLSAAGILTLLFICQSICGSHASWFSLILSIQQLPNSAEDQFTNPSSLFKKMLAASWRVREFEMRRAGLFQQLSASWFKPILVAG